MNKNQLAIFENFKIRRHFDEQNEVWYFSVVDIVAALTDSINPTDYLKKLRKRDLEVGVYIGTNCPQIEMLTDIAKGARKELESKTGKSVVSGKNFLLQNKNKKK